MIVHGVSAVDTIKNTVIDTVVDVAEEIKGYSLAIGSGMILGIIEAKKALKKEKGVPEGYENDVLKIVKECNWIEWVQ